MAVGLQVSIDAGAAAVALDLFWVRGGDLSTDEDGFVAEFLSLIEGGTLFRVVKDGWTFRMEPTEAFKALLAEMA